MDPIKLRGIKDWPELTTVKELQQFLGFVNYYWWFIQGYGNLTAPLNTLLKKTKKYEWTPECQKAFDTLKERFMEAPVLYMPDQTKPFILETDALKHASGAVLRQQDSNGDWHPCRYLSKSFTETEWNYDIGDRELLAVIRALEEWRHYLLGSPHEVILLSDHKNLGYFKQPQKLNP